MLLYYLFKGLMRLALTVWYRRRVFTGFENIPATGPLIFACNHPNSFLDAMIIATFIKRETHFLARGDVFNSPLKLWILSQFKLIPIFRLQEGAENLGKNKETFERCHAIFRKGGAVLMFSEGLCIQELRLRPLKKGTARIALEYVKDGASLAIIPTGLNYLKPMNFREDVLISMDTPFNAADLASEYRENPSKAIQTFNKKLLTGLQNSVIDIHDKKKEKEIEQLIEVEYNNGADLKKLVHTVKQVNELQLSDPDEYKNMTSLLASYKAALTSGKVGDEAASGKSSSILWLLPGLVVFGIAFWLYLLPVGWASNIVKKKVKLPEFKDSVLMGAGVVLTLVYWIILFIVVSTTLSIQVAIALILIFILFALLAGPGYDALTGVRNKKVLAGSPDKENILKLRKQVSEIPSSVLDFVKPHQAHQPVG